MMFISTLAKRNSSKTEKDQFENLFGVLELVRFLETSQPS